MVPDEVHAQERGVTHTHTYAHTQSVVYVCRAVLRWRQFIKVHSSFVVKAMLFEKSYEFDYKIVFLLKRIDLVALIRTFMQIYKMDTL